MKSNKRVIKTIGIIILVSVSVAVGHFIYPKKVYNTVTVTNTVEKEKLVADTQNQTLQENGTNATNNIATTTPSTQTKEIVRVEVPKIVEKEVIREVAKQQCADGFFTLANGMVAISIAKTLEGAQLNAKSYIGYLDYYDEYCL